MTRLLGLAWGGVAALPFSFLARRELVRGRARAVASGGGPPARARRVSGGRLVRNAVVLAVVRVAGVPRRRRHARRHEAAIWRELPVVVDLVGVAVGAGCTPFLALEHAARFGPERCGAALRGVTRSCALGSSLDDSLRDLGTAVPALRCLTDTLRTSARLGTPAAPALARLAREVRADARRRAEAHARTVPVRLCFPLVVCVLPAFALLTVVPVVLGGVHA